MSLTTREPETDVLELKGGNRESLRKSYNGRKHFNFKKSRNLETEKVVTDDGSSMTSGGAHVKSVQNELKEHATSVAEISGINTSDEEEYKPEKAGGGDNPLDKEVIHSKQLHFKLSKNDLDLEGSKRADAIKGHRKSQDHQADKELLAAAATSSAPKSSLSKFCTSCGWHFNNSQHRFCAQCGHKRM